MLLLAIETATNVCSAALAREEGLEYVIDGHLPRKHSEMLVPIIERLLELSGTSVDQLDAIAVSIGPGSFTGLRIGLSTAKGMGFSHNLDLLAIPTLAATAWGVRHMVEEVAVLHHSHREQYFCATYRLGELPVPIVEPYRDTLESILDRLDPQMPLVMTGGQDTPVPEAVRKNGIVSSGPVSALGVAMLALCAPERWRVENPYTTEPNYLREYEATKYQNPLQDKS